MLVIYVAHFVTQYYLSDCDLSKFVLRTFKHKIIKKAKSQFRQNLQPVHQVFNGLVRNAYICGPSARLYCNDELFPMKL